MGRLIGAAALDLDDRFRGIEERRLPRLLRSDA